ncbi:histone deacetylase [Rhodococcoides trifolii]|uniref:Histone deacetylase n=1 Tax=Rhodococcoides trifolii TaxID=908250 RepID=A0A917CVA3_9NOCA|nr:hypothetical protein [Rhodococcus trifolii]GGF99420.1 histone deacetylase [Rhodococcus trifolii]
MKVFYSPQYVGATHAFDTTRKAGWIADSLTERLIASVEIVSPRPVSFEQLNPAHSTTYIQAVQNGNDRLLAEGNGFQWSHDLYPMVASSNGGAIDAAYAALSDGVAGSLSSGLHHASRDNGAGFCTFNGLAVAALDVLATGAARNVMIVDFDAHNGGGTADIIGGNTSVIHVDVSVDSFDRHEGSVMVDDAADYLPTCATELSDAIANNDVDLVLYNAGMDPFEKCDIGGLDGITHPLIALREQLVFDACRHAGIPVAFVMAGGYTGSRLSQDGVVELHRMTIATAVDRYACTDIIGGATPIAAA